MEAQLIAALILLPFAGVFIYAGIHEYRRYRSEGRASYGLVYDEETGASHVTGINEGEDGYDPAGFDPNDYNKRADRNEDESEADKAQELRHGHDRPVEKTVRAENFDTGEINRS